METKDEPEGQLALMPLPARLLMAVLVPAVSILTCILSDGRPPILLRCTNQCLATPDSSVMPSSSSTESGTHAGVPTWVPVGQNFMGMAPLPGLQYRSHVRSCCCAALCSSIAGLYRLIVLHKCARKVAQGLQIK